MAGAPSVEHELGLDHRGYFVFAFAVPLVIAAVLEAGVAAWSDFVSRRKLMAGAQLVLAASLALAGVTHRAWGLAIALAVAGTASGIACGAAQALMLEEDSRGTDHAMVRWSLFSSIGDVLTPLVTGAVLALGRSYRSAMFVIAGVVLVQLAGSLAVRRDEPPAEEKEDSEPILRALARAARLPRLWLWLFASSSCTLLDEIVIALVALRMVNAQSVDPSRAALSATAFAVGAVLGDSVMDRVVARFGSKRLLIVSALASAVALVALMPTPHPLVATAILFVLGLACAPHHPLSLARAYDEMPGRPGIVQASLQAFAIIDVLAPIALGLIVHRWGLTAAIGCLLLQPLVILVSSAGHRGADR